MRSIIFLFLFFLAIISGFSQVIPFNYSVKVVPVTVSGLPGLHSFVIAQSGGKWLIIGGRIDGLHARQPFNAFPAASNNTNIYVVDINAKQFWSSSVNALPVGLKEQLQSTNMNFYQDADSLFIVGGYGYSATAIDHITFPNLTSVSVNGLINAVVGGNSITPYFKQITDQRFAVNGGQLGKIGGTYYLVGGHKFDGRYNPMGNNTYTQTYVDGIRKFELNNSGAQLSYTNYTTVTDMVHLHRRDYNLLPQVFSDGSLGYTISSGVFQVGIDLPFLYPVDIRATGHTPITSFSQYLSNYHSAKVSLYDSTNNAMHSLFFGGMSQYYYSGTTLIQDNSVPFVKTISRLSRNSSGALQESAFPNEMPSLIGASSEFVYNHQLAHYSNEVLKMSVFTGDSVLVGHIVGGIFSPQINPFTNNNTAVTSANSTIYEVWLMKNAGVGIASLNGINPVKLNVYPNPSNGKLIMNIVTPYIGYLELLITDMSGKIVKSVYFGEVSKGLSEMDLSDKVKLNSGNYTFNFVFDGKYTNVEKVIINK